MIRPQKSDPKVRKPKDKDKNNSNLNNPKTLRNENLKNGTSLNQSTNKKVSKVVSKNNSPDKKWAWNSTFIYVNPHIENPIKLKIFSSPINYKIFEQMCDYAQKMLKKREEQEAIEESMKSKSKKFFLGDLFPSARIFKKKKKNVEPSCENKLKIKLLSKEIHPYHSMSTNEEMKKFPNIKYQSNKFDDHLFNENGLPPWINDDEDGDTETSDSETDTNLNIDSTLIVDLYNDRLKLVSSYQEGSYTINPYKKNMTSLSKLDSLFKWEYIVSNTIRSLAGIIEGKEIHYEPSEAEQSQINKRVSFNSLPTHYLAFRRECPYKKYIKVPYTCSHVLKTIEKENKS